VRAGTRKEKGKKKMRKEEKMKEGEEN